MVRFAWGAASSPEMEDKVDEERKNWHRKFAADCFNRTWDLLDQESRTPEEDLQMIHTAHASRYHWGEIGTPLEFARGDWQISRVYALLGDGNSALKYARSSLNHCLENGIDDFDLAFAYEALARSSAILKDKKNVDHYHHLAEEAAKGIKDQNNLDYFMRELNAIK